MLKSPETLQMQIKPQHFQSKEVERRAIIIRTHVLKIPTDASSSGKATEGAGAGFS
jgi:hypothetical protein